MCTDTTGGGRAEAAVMCMDTTGGGGAEAAVMCTDRTGGAEAAVSSAGLDPSSRAHAKGGMLSPSPQRFPSQSDKQQHLTPLKVCPEFQRGDSGL